MEDEYGGGFLQGLGVAAKNAGIGRIRIVLTPSSIP